MAVVDKGLLQMKKNFGRPLTKEEFLESEKFHRCVSYMTEDEMKKRFTM